jgi:hypothetical protein
METETILQCTICKAKIQTPYKTTYRNRYVCSPKCWNFYKSMAKLMRNLFTEILKHYPPPDEQSHKMTQEIIQDIQKEAEWIRKQDKCVYAR